jgi:hypothetical protein
MNIYRSWVKGNKKQIFAKILTAKLTDTLLASESGQPVKSKEIADLIKSEFGIPGGIVLPILAIKQNPQFVITQYDNLQKANKIDPKITWEQIVATNDANKLQEMISVSDTDLNDEDKAALEQIKNRAKNEAEIQQFVDWVEGGYKSTQIQQLGMVFDWWYANRPNLSETDYRAAQQASRDWHQRGLVYLKEKNLGGEVQVYRVGKFGDRQTVSIDDEEMQIKNLHTNVEIYSTGKKLHHCYAGSYYERYCRDVKIGEVELYTFYMGDEPYVTVEVDPRRGEITQIKGDFNRRPKEPAPKFVKKWADDKGLEIVGDKQNAVDLSNISEEDIRANYKRYWQNVNIMNIYDGEDAQGERIAQIVVDEALKQDDIYFLWNIYVEEQNYDKWTLQEAIGYQLFGDIETKLIESKYKHEFFEYTLSDEMQIGDDDGIFATVNFYMDNIDDLYDALTALENGYYNNFGDNILLFVGKWAQLQYDLPDLPSGILYVKEHYDDVLADLEDPLSTRTYNQVEEKLEEVSTGYNTKTGAEKFDEKINEAILRLVGNENLIEALAKMPEKAYYFSDNVVAHLNNILDKSKKSQRALEYAHIPNANLEAVEPYILPQDRGEFEKIKRSYLFQP